MSEPPEQNATTGLGPDKLLAIAAYGESVAAYRYLVLSERVAEEAHRRFFADLADEEQEHKQRLQKLLFELYPNADFVLSSEDKERVVTGPRLLDVHREISFEDALRMMLETERKVAEFYARCGDELLHESLKPLFQKLATEGAGHYQRLLRLAHEKGIATSDDA